MTEDDTFMILRRPTVAEMRVILFEVRYDEFFMMPLEEFHNELRKYGWDPKVLLAELKQVVE